MPFSHVYARTKFFLVALVLVVATAVSPTADATPITIAPAPSASPVGGERSVIEVQSCNAVREFCRARWGRSNQWTRCVRARGCRARRARVINYCREVRRRCSVNYVPGYRPHRRCMIRNGC